MKHDRNYESLHLLVELIGTVTVIYKFPVIIDNYLRNPLIHINFIFLLWVSQCIAWHNRKLYESCMTSWNITEKTPQNANTMPIDTFWNPFNQTLTPTWNHNKTTNTTSLILVIFIENKPLTLIYITNQLQYPPVHPFRLQMYTDNK